MEEEIKGINSLLIRNSFYYRSYRRIIIANILVIILLAAIITFARYHEKTIKRSKYFPTTEDGVLIELPPLDKNHLHINNFLVDNKGFLLDQPKINIDELGNDLEHGLVLYWAKQTIIKIFDYDYLNYRRALQDMRNYFVAGGHQLYLEALNESKNLEAVIAGKRVVHANVVGEATVIKTSIINNSYAWQISIPINIFYENITDDVLLQKVIAKIWVTRTSTLQSPFFGLSIARINLDPRV